MSDRGVRSFQRAANVAFMVLVLSVVIVGFVQARRFIDEALANWPLEYEGTAQADVEIAAHSALAYRAFVLLIVDIVVGFAGLSAFAALKRIRGLAWTAATIAVIVLLGGLCAGVNYQHADRDRQQAMSASAPRVTRGMPPGRRAASVDAGHRPATPPQAAGPCPLSP